MIKILILNDVLTVGGKERRIVELLKYSKQHFDVKFEMIFMHDGIDFPEIHDTNYPIHIINWSNKRGIQGFRKILSITRAFQPDIIHSWSSMTDIIGVVLKFIIKKKFVSSMIAESLPFRSYKNKDYLRSKISFRFADVVTSNTNAGLQSFKAPISKSICIYNGFNYDRIKNLKNSDYLQEKFGFKNKFVVGMVAEFATRKDYGTVIITAKSLLSKYPGKMVFLLIGSGPLLNEMISAAGEFSKLGIIFTGLVNNVEEYVDTFNIGILCTNNSIHGEGISNSIMECMALAKPVIATEGGGTGEIVSDQETGFLIPPKDPLVLEQKILYLRDNPTKANEMGLAGQNCIKEKFTIEAMCNSFFEIYKRLS